MLNQQLRGTCYDAPMRAPLLIAIGILVVVPVARAADLPPLVLARTAYNMADYDAAVAAATEARREAETANAAALVLSRALLERYRLRGEPLDLADARRVLDGIDRASLTPRDRLDLLIGLGQALYFTDAFGAAAEIFEPLLSGSVPLPRDERARLLDWWAGALDREAQERGTTFRVPLYRRIVGLMERELRLDPASQPGNYWLAAALRGGGELERAWDAATAGWVRSTIGPVAPAARADIDRLVREVLVPERARRDPPAERDSVSAALTAEWVTFTGQWP